MTTEEQFEDQFEDEFEQLRQKSMRTSASHEAVEEEISTRSTGVLSKFSPSQRLILAVLLLADIIVVGLVLLVMTNVIDL